PYSDGRARSHWRRRCAAFDVDTPGGRPPSPLASNRASCAAPDAISPRVCRCFAIGPNGPCNRFGVQQCPIYGNRFCHTAMDDGRQISYFIGILRGCRSTRRNSNVALSRLVRGFESLWERQFSPARVFSGSLIPSASLLTAALHALLWQQAGYRRQRRAAVCTLPPGHRHPASRSQRGHRCAGE
ncbi:MAG: hypothetical protein HW392_1890, partial [Steroidobacteraceae bacterium]|nr:hypothetical protein [Steroidobacteraceae bacterium]